MSCTHRKSQRRKSTGIRTHDSSIQADNAHVLDHVAAVSADVYKSILDINYASTILTSLVIRIL